MRKVRFLNEPRLFSRVPREHGGRRLVGFGPSMNPSMDFQPEFSRSRHRLEARVTKLINLNRYERSESL